MSYILRSSKNVEVIDKAKHDNAVINEARSKATLPALLWSEPGPLPGDGVVDRGFRTVYYIHSDGSRRRVDDPEAKAGAIARVKDLLQKAKVQ